MPNHFEQFKDKKYLNLETYRKNGQVMPTPVWFVQDGEVFYVRTGANSGKVKRIRLKSRSPRCFEAWRKVTAALPDECA